MEVRITIDLPGSDIDTRQLQRILTALSRYGEAGLAELTPVYDTDDEIVGYQLIVPLVVG
jgi:hypothetical protein